MATNEVSLTGRVSGTLSSGARVTGTLSLALRVHASGPAWNPSLLTSLYAAPAVALCRAGSLLWKDAAKTLLATAAGDPVRVVQCPFTGAEFTAPSDAARPTLRNPESDTWYLEFDGTNDRLNFGGIASIPLSAHFAFRQTDGQTGVGVAGGNGAQKFKINELDKRVGGKEGAFNWSASTTARQNNVDYVAGINYGSTGKATYWLAGATDGLTSQNVEDAAFSANITSAFGRPDNDGEFFKDRMYAWAIATASQSDADLELLHDWLAGYQ